LRLKADNGGDGVLYRAAEPWDSTPTWNEVGDVLTGGPSVGVGLNDEISMEFDVTAHVELWANGTFNQGWVIKGGIDDCQAARIYNGTASASNKPRLRVIFIPPMPPDTAGPRVVDVDIGSTVSTHAERDVPVGSGEQIRTIPVARPNQIFVRFNENVTNVNVSAFSLVSANTGNTYQLATEE
jgi:hypothetical protein